MKKILIILLIPIIMTGGVFFYWNLSFGETLNVADINQLEIRIQFKAKILSYIKGGYYNLYIDLLDKGYTPQEALNYISESLGDNIALYAQEHNIDAVDASLKFTKDYNAPFIYYKGEEGRKIDLTKLFEDTVISLDTKDSIEPTYIVYQPNITEEDLYKMTSLRAKFSTNYSTSSSNRKNNINKAAEYLNGHIIEPEGIMSFNEVVGKRTVARGFRSADIIYQGKMVKGIGGGVCQVSSTMYNAGLLAGMNVISSSRHSRKVFYLPASRDAMVSDGTDLILANPTAYPMFILTKATENDIIISIYGEESALRYEVNSTVMNVIPPPKDKIIVEGDNIPLYIREALESNDPVKLKNIAYREERIVKQRAGMESQAYLYIYDNDKLIEKSLISHDMYYPQQGVVLRSII